MEPDADRVRLDVFALGAVAYHILVGRPAATDRAALRALLSQGNGLDLAPVMPQVSEAVRSLVLESTRPVASERLADIPAFLTVLAEAERVLTEATEDEQPDPLAAVRGAVLDGRFRLERRLGAGSTAVGLLVADISAGDSKPETMRVLKVANDDSAAARLQSEAEILSGLDDPRIARLVEGPVLIGGRSALVLEAAGDETLAEVLRGRERLSLDLLERWGTDLLQALVALDRAGVNHRDIKPANLGVRENRGDRARHLVLFDFSLARSDATAINAGTAPYLDPFLELPGRGRFDSAAERYSAAVVLFEMAAGTSPQFGDGISHPATLTDEATVEPGMFDPAVADRLVIFFRRALARDATARFDTAAEMLAAWQSVFTPVPAVADNADSRAARATPSTALAEAGLSARALSALEPFGLRTVADLVAVDPVRLNRMSGVADVTRREVRARAARWRQLFAQSVTGRGEAVRPAGTAVTLPDPATAVEMLLEHAGAERAQSRRRAVRLLLGLEGDFEAFGSQSDLSATLGVTPARTAQQLGNLQDGWAGDTACRDLLDALAGVARQALADLGGVATVVELADTGLAAMPPTAALSADQATRVTAGLLRLALDRAQALTRAGDEGPVLTPRRHGGRIVLLATDPALLDPAESLGRIAFGEPVADVAAADQVRARGPDDAELPRTECGHVRRRGREPVGALGLVVTKVEAARGDDVVKPRPLGQRRQCREPGAHAVADLLCGDLLASAGAGQRQRQRKVGIEVAVVQLQ